MKYKVPQYKGLDDLVSEFIRRRAIKRVGGCEKCLSAKSDYKRLQNCHFHGRLKISVRFDEDNLNGFCSGCHRWLDSQPDEYREWKLAELGQKRYDELLLRSKITPSKIDINLLTLYYQARLL